MFTLEFITKTLVSALIITLISYVSRRSSLFAGIIASLPLTSILALIWMHHGGSSVGSMIEFSSIIFWMVLPSLVFFIVFPALLRLNIPFYGALMLASIVLIGVYSVYTQILLYFNIKL